MKMLVLFVKVVSINYIFTKIHFFLIKDTNVTYSNCTDYNVQLVDGPSLNEGRLLICINGVWGTFCNSGIDYNDAGVICLELGYQRGFVNGHFYFIFLLFRRLILHWSVP